MDLNTVSICILSIPIIYLIYLYLSLPKEFVPEKPKFLWGEQVGKSKVIQSKTGDASMSTELTRRRAIQQAGRLDRSKIKETRTSSGTTTGAIETFFISSICPPLPFISITNFFDAGISWSEFCNVLDGNGSIVYDGGSVSVSTCSRPTCPSNLVFLDAENDQYCITMDGSGDLIYDGGNQTTTFCGL
jgi:hypothetical protein